MLILTRKLGESINIGEEIKISVLGIHGRQVRIGIDAPMNIVVHREEIYIKIQEENRRAAGSLTSDLKAMVRKIKGKIGSNPDTDSNSSKINFNNNKKSEKSSNGNKHNRRDNSDYSK